MTPAQDQNFAGRDKPGAGQLDLMLREIHSLPTPTALAGRLLELCSQPPQKSGADDELAALVRLDAALTARLISHLADSRGEGAIWPSLHAPPAQAFRAVVFSVQPFEAGSQDDGESTDWLELWRHCLATAIAAEMIAAALPGIDAREAYVCGLLHDLGKLALWQVLPKSCRRVLQAARDGNGNIADFEREILGVDHTVVGRRLAEMWRLPASVQQAVWLHHQPPASLPESVANRRLVAAIRLADALAYETRLGSGGNFALAGHSAELAQSLGLTPQAMEQIQRELPREFAKRSAPLAAGKAAGDHAYRQALAQSSARLAQLNEQLRQRTEALREQARAFGLLREFASGLGGEALVGDVLPRVAGVLASSAGVEPSPSRKVLAYSLSQEYPEVLCVLLDGLVPAWLVLSRSGASLEVPGPSASPGAQAASALLGTTEELQQWIDLNAYVHRPLLCEGRWIGGVFLPRSMGDHGMGVPPMCDTGVSPVAVSSSVSSSSAAAAQQQKQEQEQQQDRAGTALEHMGRMPMPQPAPQSEDLQQALAAAAALALAMVQGRARAVLLGEQFAQASQVLDQTQDALTETRTLAAIVEMSAGAAHELNNPLAIISGRAQLMLSKATRDENRKIWTLMSQQAQRISDIISELMAFASPPPPRVSEIDPEQLLQEACSKYSSLDDPQVRTSKVDITVSEGAGRLQADREQILGVLVELMLNAATASGKSAVIHLSAQAGPEDNQVTLVVRDEGPGMDRATLSRAFTPFFSAQPAGRRRGLGLPKARRTIEANGGRIYLRSEPGQGAAAVVQLPAASRARQ
jgi:putative nucleotidyltransferase with HDIG domain